MRYRNPVTEPSKNCRDRDLRPAATEFCRGFGDLCQICAHLYSNVENCTRAELDRLALTALRAMVILSPTALVTWVEIHRMMSRHL